MDIPIYSADLIAALRDDNPLRIPQVTQSDREIFMEAGRQKLLADLEQSLKIQIEEKEQHTDVFVR